MLLSPILSHLGVFVHIMVPEFQLLLKLLYI